MDLSVVVPVFDEEENVQELYERILAVLDGKYSFEVIFVDDGSRDATVPILIELRETHPNIGIIELRKNCGQTAAMKAGIDHARGEVIITMDGDLQNDPKDIPRLVETLGDAYDLVTGWRRDRQDLLLSRKVPSRIANWLIRKITGVQIHDNGCSLKAFRAEVIKATPLYSEMHRFIPAMMTVAGARIAEIVVSHHARQRGKSKYGISRVGKVFFDIITIKMLIGFSDRPLHWFGLLSVPAGLISALFLLLFLLPSSGISSTAVGPVFGSVAVLGAYLSVHFVTMGLLAELIVKMGNDYEFRSASRIGNAQSARRS